MALDAGATQAEALVMRTSNALTRFANNEIHQNVAEADTVVNLRFIDGQRAGVASGNRVDEASLRALSRSAATIARLQPERPDLPRLADPRQTLPVAGAYAASTTAADPDVRADAAMAIISAAAGVGVQAFGLCRSDSDEVSVANSAGVLVSETRSSAQVLTVMSGPSGGTGYAEQVAVDIDALDASAIGKEAADRTVRMSDPIALPAGDYPVVLESYAVMDIADMLGYLGFSALAVQEERSFFEAGKRIGSALVTMVDDAADPAGTPASFDY
jgi:PmbA protein